MRRLQVLAVALAFVGAEVVIGDEPASSDRRFEKLVQKRAQLRELQQEVSRLERELGVARIYHVRLFIGEIPIHKLRQFDLKVPPSEGRMEKLAAAELFGVSDTPADGRSGVRPDSFEHREFRHSQVNAESFQRLIDDLKAAKAVKILAEPTLVAEAGQSARMHSGGEFPIPLPTPGKERETSVEWRKFGIRIETKIVPVDRGIVRLTISAEHSVRDFKNAVKLNGQTVPGLRTSRVNTESRMEMGQTLLLAMPMQNRVRFFAVTPLASPGSTPAP